MELDLGPEIAEFRAELRDWIAAEAPDALAGLSTGTWPRPEAARARREGRGATTRSTESGKAKLAARRLIPRSPESTAG